MSEEEFTHHIQIIRQQIEALCGYIHSKPTVEQLSNTREQIGASLENLQLFDEQRQASLELMAIVQEELLAQNEYLAVERQDYYDLFKFAPDAYLVTNTQGIIQKANVAAANLLNVPQQFLIGKPLIYFVAETERSIFRTKLNHLPQNLSQISVQEWEITMCPRFGQLFDASFLVTPMGDLKGSLLSLRIIIRDITKYKQLSLKQLDLQSLPTVTSIPRSLDGLRVLFVDDETDAREFITTVLEQYGIEVTAVATVAEALSVLEQSLPDVLLSDIKMPDEDGYALIKKVRAIEAEKGCFIPTAALTAYLAEDRVKAIKAGFQSHLHKLSEPTKLVEMVAKLAGRG
ncbi:putative PAS/PAC sensor protein [Calothrix sp. NIES-4071]|nr:putative PAS/PAC sensor protein [Calothrix sp. NIES-4071]BAZ62890.1 putative PAS/PAC sensor protein [Calothrix sp. NIES-4105]